MNVRRIYNSLVENTEEAISDAAFKRFVRRRLEPIHACFSEERFPSAEGSDDIVVLLPRWKPLIEWQVNASATWASALEECLLALPDGAPVHPIIYSDDITCGNVLAPVKSKKISAFYIGLREMKPHLHCKEAWLTACAVQCAIVEKIQGGLAAIFARLVQLLFSDENTQGFAVALPAGPRLLRLGSPGHVLADHDAQRAVYAAKGSAAVSPCIHCCNIHKRDMDSVAGWYSILEHRSEKFVARVDADTFACLDSMVGMTAAERDLQEKALGFRLVTSAVTSCRVGRQHLPPSRACNEVLHDYFCNGVASWELGCVLGVYEKHGVNLKAVLSAAQTAGWRRSGEGSRFRPNILKSLFHEKMWETERNFKGDGNDCWSLVFLLGYYVATDDLSAEPAARDSFLVLKQICSELRRLSYAIAPLDSGRVQKLRCLQRQHQELFRRAWGDDLVRPKHHHRFHIPAACEQLQFLPHCGIQEKKHQEIKHGLIDCLEGCCGDSLRLQRAMLARLVLRNAEASEKYGLGDWGLGKPVREATKEDKLSFRDNGLVYAESVSMWKRKITLGDMVLLTDNIGGQFVKAVSGPACGLYMQLQTMEKIADHQWGSRWKTSAGLKKWWKPQPEIEITLAAWWCFRGSDVCCLH